MNRVIHISVLGLLNTLYVLFSLLGYLTFGSGTVDNILKAYDNNDKYCLIGQVCIAAVMAFKFPLIALPFRDLFNDVALPEWFQLHIQGNKKRKSLWVATEMGIFCVVVVSVVIQFDDLGKLLGILGATVGTMLSFVLPGMFGIRCSTSQTETILSGLMVLFGVVSGVAGFVACFVA